MSSTLKLAIPLVTLVGLVFGVTLLTQNAPTGPVIEPNTTKGEKGPKPPPDSEPPLRFFTSDREWDPPKLDEHYRELPLLAASARPTDPGEGWKFGIQNRLFQGVYEQDVKTVRTVQFWFENRNPESVTIQLHGVSCTACSQGLVTTIPTEVTRNLLCYSALAALPTGAFNAFGVGLVQPTAELSALPREPMKFREHPHATWSVPGAKAGDAWAPQWGILELRFEVRGTPGEPQKPLTAEFAVQVDGTNRGTFSRFVVSFDVANPVEVWPPLLDLGRLDQLTSEKEYTFRVFSSTRGPGSEYGNLELTRKDTSAQGVNGLPDEIGFVQVTKVERVPDKDLPDVAELLAKARSRPARIRSAFEVTAVLRPRVGDHRLDIGAFERTVAVTASGVVQQVQIRGLMRGPVWLDEDRTDIDMAAFKGGAGTQQDVRLITEKPGMELAIVKDECKPAGYTYALVKQPDSEGRGIYKLRITVPPGQQFGRARGEVVLEVKGPTPQRIRIPVRSTAEL
jgi:hypothetical protein